MIGYDLKRAENSTAHHTDDYDGEDSMILRRGNDFTFELLFSGPLKSTDEFEIELIRGSNPQLSDDTKFLICFNKEEGTISSHNWKMDIQHLSYTRVAVTISIPSNCPIGPYEMWVNTSSGDDFSRPIRENVVILFNPWNKGNLSYCAVLAPCKCDALTDDGVYMESAAEREEYVLNNVGLIYCGSLQIPIPVHWNYAQVRLYFWSHFSQLNRMTLVCD